MRMLASAAVVEFVIHKFNIYEVTLAYHPPEDPPPPDLPPPPEKLLLPDELPLPELHELPELPDEKVKPPMEALPVFLRSVFAFLYHSVRLKYSLTAG